MLQVIAVILFLCCFGSFTWALQGGFFTSTEDKSLGITLTRIFGLVFMLLHLWALVATRLVQPLGLLSGIVLYILALWLFWYAVAANWKRPLALAFTKTPPHHLVAGGPYRLIRHPFYTSYLLAWGAGFAVTGNPLTLLALAVMGSLYWLAARSEERLFAQSSLAGTYQAYKSETGMFWPKFQALSAIHRSKLDSSIKK